MKRTSVTRRKPRKRRVDERGVALILVLGAITVLTVFLTQLQEETSSELASALSERDALKAEYLARSAVNLSRLLIATEPEISKAVGPLMLLMTGGKGGTPQIPVWEFTDLVLGPFNDAESTQSFLSTINGDASTAKNLGLSGGHFEITIVDEDGKVNLNLPAANDHDLSANRFAEQLLSLITQPAYAPMFEGRDADGQFTDTQAICSALIDWVDSAPDGNEIQDPCQPHVSTHVSTGPEDNYYQTINLAYLRKNAAFDSLDEVRLVRGITDDFWANFIDPEPDNPKKRIMSVWGQSQININSASAQTLLALVCGQDFGTAVLPEVCTDPLQMSAFIMAVTLGKSFTMGLPLFGSATDFIKTMKGQGLLGPILTSLNVKPVTFKNDKQVAKSLTTKSKRFSIYADGVVPGYKRTTKVRIHAVIDTTHSGSLGPNGAVVIGGGQAAANAAAAAAATPATGKGSSASSNAPTPGSADAILAQLNSNPAGTVIYWRIE
jgi:general secretion pathway protein K